MKIALKALVVSAVCLCTFFTACSKGKSTLLGKPAEAQRLSYSENVQEDYVLFKDDVNSFTSALSAGAYKAETGDANFVMSPVSVFFALSIAAGCSSGDTREQILSALGVTYSQLENFTSTLYNSVNDEYRGGISNKITGMLKPANSIWIDSGIPVNSSCIDNLSSKFCTYSYYTDFHNDNKNANLAIRNFIKEQTNGLIDRNYSFPQVTNFVLLNTLYLKDIWNIYGDNLGMTSDKYTFVNADGSSEQLNLLSGYYNLGRTYTDEKFSAFFTKTYHNYYIKFLVPAEGYGVNDIFTAENIEKVNSIKEFDPYDDVNMYEYHTRCLFPEFTASYDGYLKSVLSDMGITDLFSAEDCDFSALTDEPTYCDDVIHSASLTVNKRGIEGAAVTVIPGAGAPGPGEYTLVYEDFVVDRAFGFILSDTYGVNLFSGVINFI